MKKILIAFLTTFFCLTLTSCFETTKFPDMVEYSEEEVLEVAKEKYNIKRFYYTGVRVNKKDYEKEEFSYDNFDCCGILNNLVNPNNVEVALTSFAGKNGGHDIQGMFRYFACYVALGIDEDNNAKFIYYNTNINKNKKIEDTIGSSDYPYDLHPSKINTRFMDEITMDWLRAYFKKMYNDEISIKGLYYCFDKPTIITYLGSRDIHMIQFYEENNKTVFDIFRIELDDHYYTNNINEYITNQELIYSTSNQYEIYYAKYGANPNDFFEIKYTVEQSTEASYLDLVSGTITLKDVGKEVVSYSFNYCITYKVKMENGDITTQDHLHWHTELRNNRFGLLIDQIEGINHEETTTVTIESWRIIYKK